MFHKALWMWNWKRGKYAALLFFLSTLYYLSFRYYREAQLQLAKYYNLQEKGTFDYYYAFRSNDSSFLFTILIIFLACLLIGWERSNQSITSLMGMPFKRKDVFLSKWTFGSFCIIGSFLINWILMYFIYRTTIHFDYQSFGPFHRYFLYAIVSYVAVYTAALCIGTFTGGIVSQIVFCIPWLLMGFTFISLLYNFTINSLDITYKNDRQLYASISEFNKKTNTVAPIDNFSISYYYNPERNEETADSSHLKGPEFHIYYSAKSMLVPIFYTIFYLLIGTYLYKRSPIENSQKIFIFQKHLRIWIWIVTIYFALLGSYKLPLFNFLFNPYTSMCFAGIITYFVLKRLTNYKVF